MRKNLPLGRKHQQQQQLFVYYLVQPKLQVLQYISTKSTSHKGQSYMTDWSNIM